MIKACLYCRYFEQSDEKVTEGKCVKKAPSVSNENRWPHVYALINKCGEGEHDLNGVISNRIYRIDSETIRKEIDAECQEKD